MPQISHIDPPGYTQEERWGGRPQNIQGYGGVYRVLFARLYTKKIDESLISGLVLISLMLGLSLLKVAVRILDYSPSVDITHKLSLFIRFQLSMLSRYKLNHSP